MDMSRLIDKQRQVMLTRYTYGRAETDDLREIYTPSD
jgi:hypothetical protein